jgi:hypothetical protein
MRLYLDDDSAWPLLAQLLRHAGHDVELPVEAGLSGAADPVHLGHAVAANRVFLSHNYQDFEDLHDLILIVGGHHPGILLVRRDNNPKRDLDDRGIVRALTKLAGSGLNLVDQPQVLNHWR